MNYKKTYRLILDHQFFSEKTNWNPGLQPSALTAKACRNFNVVLKQINNTFEWYEGTESDEDVSNHMKGLAPSLFFIVQNDTSFYNYTNLPFVADDNQIIVYLINGDETVEKRIVTVSHRLFNIQDFQNQKIVVRSVLNGKTVLEIESLPIRNSSIDLAQLGEGVFELFANDQLITSVLYTESLIPQNSFAALWIADYSANSQQIQIETRNCYWEYEFIISDSYKMEPDFSLSVSHDKNEFIGPTIKIRDDGQVIHQFQSRNEFLLKDKADENPKAELLYKAQHTKINKKHEILLPAPDAASLHSKESINGEVQQFVSSKIYI